MFLAFVVSYIVRVFKQPIIVGYIIAGIIISPFIIEYGVSKDIINVFSNFGIAFLLFMVGLHLNPKVIKEIGTVSLLTGLAQMIITFIVGFLISWILFGFNTVTSSYIGIAIAFSSTIIIMKLLSDRGQLDSLYGKLSIGILIIQDIVAIVVLMFISSMYFGAEFGFFTLKSVLSGVGLIIFIFFVGFLVLPRIIKGIAKSQEILFLFSITWCFLVAALFNYFGFSIEIGALIAGVVLSISPYSTEISAKIRPLRDFFIIIFFMILGLSVQLSNIGSILVNAFILSLAVLIFKPFIVMFLLTGFGYTKRTNFLVGTALAQISEFSLIILALGVSVGHISGEILSTLTLTMIMTIALSSYMIIYSQEFYKMMAGIVSIFERKNVKKERKIKREYNAILFGYNRIGFSILRSLKSLRKNYLVVDFNPDIIDDLKKLGISCLYGDAYDSDLLEDLPLDKTELVVSTIPDYETNLLLIESVKAINPKCIVIVRAHSIGEAMDFYKKGANYVLTPHFLGGDYVAKMIETIKTDEKGYEEERKKHMKMLMERLEEGHEHPKVERN